jgi:hypothetical protein
MSGLLLAFPRPAAGFCTGLGSQPGVTLGGRYRTTLVGYQAVNAYIQGRDATPIVNSTSAWDMLKDPGAPGDRSLAQAGTLRRVGWSAYYPFAAWSSSTGVYVEDIKPDSPNPSLNHTYLVEALADNSYQFSFDGTVFDHSLPNQGWWPYQIQFFGETHDRGDHFPGSTAAQVEFWGLTMKISDGWYTVDSMTNGLQGYTDIPGINAVAPNDFYIWDTRCSDV